jgi:HD-GYP domain-containing protein (c-di-GMP phosphodiesterase class II)
VAGTLDGPGKVRLTELLAMLSLGTDLGMGHPMEHAIRQSLLAVRLAERAGLDQETRGVVYYSSLLAWVGCHVDAYEQAKWFGDDLALKADIRQVDLGKPIETAAYLVRHLGSGRPALERTKLGLTFMGEGQRALSSMFDNHWRAAARLIERLGLGDAVRDSVAQTFERWDGKGAPSGAQGADVLVSSRLVNITDVAEAHYARGGLPAAVEVVRARSGSQFDPALVDLFCSAAPSLFAELEAVRSWDAAMAIEPTLERHLSEQGLEQALEAIADFVDLKSPYTIGHSRAVADLAGTAGRNFGLPESDAATVRRAGLLHDLGRLGVSNGIWDKKGPLTPVELERIRLHPYLTERMLASSAALAPFAAIAVQHHERLDGSGYPRGASGSAFTPAGRILAAADMYRAHLEPRPHRPARTTDEAAADIRGEVRFGRLDGDAVAAVLSAAGHRVRRQRFWPAGLSTREVEVLRLLARGLSHKEIAERLVISPKTASNHVERIYTKIGASNRAMAGVFAVQHGLMLDDLG